MNPLSEQETLGAYRSAKGKVLIPTSYHTLAQITCPLPQSNPHFQALQRETDFIVAQNNASHHVRHISGVRSTLMFDLCSMTNSRMGCLIDSRTLFQRIPFISSKTPSCHSVHLQFPSPSVSLSSFHCHGCFFLQARACLLERSHRQTHSQLILGI